MHIYDRTGSCRSSPIAHYLSEFRVITGIAGKLGSVFGSNLEISS